MLRKLQLQNAMSSTEINNTVQNMSSQAQFSQQLVEQLLPELIKKLKV